MIRLKTQSSCHFKDFRLHFPRITLIKNVNQNMICIIRKLSEIAFLNDVKVSEMIISSTLHLSPRKTKKRNRFFGNSE